MHGRLLRRVYSVQQFAAHGTVGYTQRKPHRATLSGELMAVRLLRLTVG
jgi:hypothetical protein